MRDSIIHTLVGGCLVFLGCIAGCEIRDARYVYVQKNEIRGPNNAMISSEIIREKNGYLMSEE